MVFLDTPMLLLTVALCLRLLPLRADRHEPWRTPVDLGLALGLGLLTMAVKAWWLAPYALMDGTDTSDIAHVCSTVESLRDLDAGGVRRQPGAALLPALLSRPLGLFDGVAAGALLSTAALGAAQFLWARVLHSRLAGVAAAIFSCAFSCYVIMPRYLTFYPESVAAYALCAAAVAAALRWRNLMTLGLAGAGVGLTLAVDHTGLLYALVPLALAGLVAMAVPLRRIPLRLAVLTLPILLSWFGARLITPASMPTLEDKALLFTMDNVGHPVPRPQQPGYNWGRSGPLGMTRALWTLARLSREEPDPEAPLVKARRLAHEPARAAQVVPWIPVALVALLLAGVALRRRPWELAGQAALLLPFAALLWTAANTQALPKYLMAPMLPLPVLLGVAWAWLAHRRREDAREKAGGPLRRLAAPAVTAAVLTLMVTGAVPGWLAPDASRRLAMSTDPSFYQVYTHDPEDRSARLEACFRLFQADQRRGVPARSRLFPRDRFRRRWLAIHGEKQPAGQPCQP